MRTLLQLMQKANLPPNEGLPMSLLFSQYEMINWLVPKLAELSKEISELEDKEEKEKSNLEGGK